MVDRAGSEHDKKLDTELDRLVLDNHCTIVV